MSLLCAYLCNCFYRLDDVTTEFVRYCTDTMQLQYLDSAKQLNLCTHFIAAVIVFPSYRTFGADFICKMML